MVAHKIARKGLKKGLDMAGGTHKDRRKEKKEEEKKKREKVQKDRMLKKKHEELKNVREDKEGNNGTGGAGGSGSEQGFGDEESVDDFLNREKELEDEIGKLEKERKDIDKVSMLDKTKKAYGTVKKVGKFVKRTVRNAGLMMKFWPVIGVLVGGLGIYTISSAMFMTYILPAGAFVVLTDEEVYTSEKPGGLGNETTGSGSIDVGGDIKDVGTEEELAEGSSYPATTAKHVSSLYDPNRLHPIHKVVRPHNGIDLVDAGGRTHGTDAVAFQDGVVVKAESYYGFGNVVFIDHGDKYRTYYAHLSKFSVRKGDTVKSGQKIGELGSTGDSTGAHLHFEIRKKEGNDYKPIDPKPYLTKFKLTGK